MKDDRSSKIKSPRTLYLSVAGLVLSAALVVPCWSADLKSTDAPLIKQTAPRAPAVRPKLKPSPALTGETHGKLSALAGRVTLRLTRSVTRVEVFVGRKKLATLGAGMSFDVTPYLAKATARGLTFHFYGVDGRKSIQVVGPGEVLALSATTPPESKMPGTRISPGTAHVVAGGLRESPTKSGSITAASGSTLSTGPRLQAAGIPRVAATALAAMSITSPTQGDFMVEGNQFVLQWSMLGNIPEKCVNIDLFKGISHVMAVAHNVCVNGYNWQLPQGMSGTDYKIRLRTVDNALMADSDLFSILTILPDLRISNLHIQPANPDMRDDITVMGVILNTGHGTSAATSAVVRLQAGSNWSSERTLSIPSFVFGPNAHLPFSETFDAMAVSELTATVEVDNQNLVAEADEGNNSEQITFPVIRLPNLKACIKDEMYMNILLSTHIHFRVKNYSSEPVGPTVCRTWIENKGHETHNVPALEPFEEYTFHRSVIFAQTGWKDYSFTVDYEEAVRESREEDNAKTGRIHASGVGATYPYVPFNCD